MFSTGIMRRTLPTRPALTSRGAGTPTARRARDRRRGRATVYGHSSAPNSCAPPNGPRSIANRCEPDRVGRDLAQRRLVERLERQDPRRDPRDVLERVRVQRLADLARAGRRSGPAPKSMKIAMPLAVLDEQRPSRRARARRSPRPRPPVSSAGTISPVRPPVDEPVGDHHRREEDEDRVDRRTRPPRPRSARAAASRARSGRTIIGCSSPRSASPRTAFKVRKTARIAPRKSVANIDRPSIVAPRRRSRRRRPLKCPLELVDLAWRPARRRAPYSTRKRDREQRDDDEHAPAHRLAQREPRDDRDAAHRPPTSSR